MKWIYILPIGLVNPATLKYVAEEIPLKLNYRCKIMESIGEPSYAFEPKRGQYSSAKILREILNKAQAHPVSEDLIKILGIVDLDLCTPILTFVFGEAQLGGKAALISLRRLHQEYYGLPPNPPLLLKRAVKEALHELGHTFGLTHCLDPKCVMYFSNSVKNIDTKSDKFCDSCSILLSEKKPKVTE